MIKFWSYKKEYSKIKKIIIKKIDTTISKGETFFGKELVSFEKKFTSKYKSNYGIAVGSGTEKIAYSTNGINWATIIDSDLIFSTQGNDVHWNNIRWVAVGEGTNSIAYSGEGLEWFTVTNSTNIFTKGNGVASNKKRWIAVGEGTNTIAYSDDGITWIGLGSSIFTTAGYNVIWNGIPELREGKI